MLGTSVCIQSSGTVQPEPLVQLAAALDAAGLSVHQQPDLLCPLRVLAFSGISDQLCAQLNDLARRDGWTLAVACGDQTLETDRVWELLHAGASDVIAWNDLPDPPANIVHRLTHWRTIHELADSPAVGNILVGKSPVWKRLLRRIVEIARFGQMPVLIHGQTGTGKELAARVIHQLDPRPGKPDLVVLDCTTVSPELSGSEFFGHERGAFTTAVAPREGAFALADGGTLFLDEVGELPLRLQAELLRVVQEKTYKRIGSNLWKSAHFRLVCATNRDLAAHRLDGTFRNDFYHRLAGAVIELPSLNERREDIPLLAAHFLRQCRGEQAPELDRHVLGYLLNRNYSGNIRELRQLVLHMLSRHSGYGPITAGAIPEEDRPMPAAGRAAWPDGQFEQSIRSALARGRGVDEIRNAAADLAYQIVLNDENGDTARSSLRLKVSTRAVQMWRRNGCQ